jgi:hypothetical protein
VLVFGVDVNGGGGAGCGSGRKGPELPLLLLLVELVLVDDVSGVGMESWTRRGRSPGICPFNRRGVGLIAREPRRETGDGSNGEPILCERS